MPTPLSWGEAVTVDGVVYLLAGTHRGEVLLSYDPSSDAWSELALPPGVTPGLAPAGGAVVAFARSRGPDQLGATLDHRLDLATGEWTPLPVDSVGVAANRQMVWLNEALVLLTETVPSGDGTPFVSAAELDPISGSWKLHDRADRTTNLSPWVVAGDVAVNPYGPTSVVNGQPGFPSGGIFEDGDIRVLPDTDLPWRELPGLPVAGDRYVIGHRGVLDVQTRVWTSLDPPSELADEGSATVWAGDRLLTWGGTRFGDIDTPFGTGGGWQYQPSPEDG